MKTLAILCLFSVASTFALHLPGFMLDTCERYGPAPDDQRHVALAATSTGYVAVWTDGDIYGARVTPEAALLDPAGFLVARGDAAAGVPDVAAAGAVFLVVWEQDDNILAARVTESGMVLDTGGITVCRESGGLSDPAVASDGDRFLVTWSADRTGTSDVFAARVTASGVVLDTAGVVVSSAAGNQEDPAVAFDGADYLVTWYDARDGAEVRAARVTPGGVVLDPDGIPVTSAPETQYRAAVCHGGGNSLVCWVDGRVSPGQPDIYAARVTAAGEVLDTAGVAVCTSSERQDWPAVAFNGTDYIVTWSDLRGPVPQVYAARVTPEGQVLDPDGFVVATGDGSRGEPDVAAGLSACLVAWHDHRLPVYGYDIYGARVTPQGTVLEPNGLLLSQSAPYQSRPAAAFDGTSFLAVWSEVRKNDGRADIFGTRVSPEGTILDPGGIPVAADTGAAANPGAAAGGTGFLVAWEESSERTTGVDIYGARVASDGTLLDPLGIPIAIASQNQWYPVATFDGTNFVVAWWDWRGGPDECGVYAARVTTAGELLDPAGIPVSLPEGRQGEPAIASDGNGSIVVWRKTVEVLASRVSAAGELLDSTGFPVCPVGSNQFDPSVAFDGTNYFAVWRDTRSGPYFDIYGTRISPDGSVLDSSGIALLRVVAPVKPRVAFDGGDYIVAWSDSNVATRLRDLTGVLVSTAGRVLDTFRFGTEGGRNYQPSLSSGEEGHALLVYEGWTDSTQGGMYNALRAWGIVGPFVGIQEEPAHACPVRTAGVTVVRNTLTLPGNRGNDAAPTPLMDISGRRVLDLHAGENDISHLSPGVYFVHSRVASRQSQPATRVVVLK